MHFYMCCIFVRRHRGFGTSLFSRASPLSFRSFIFVRRHQGFGTSVRFVACYVFLLFALLLKGRSWVHLGAFLGYLGPSWGLFRSSPGGIFVRRHRGFGTFIFQGLRGSFKVALKLVYCQGPFLCDVIEDLASRGLSCGHLWGSKMASRGPNLAPRGPQVAPRWPQGGPNMPQDGPKMPQEASKISPRWPEAPR